MKKWTLITGGAKGLGREIAIALAKKGECVLLHYHTSRPEAEFVIEICRQFGVEAEMIQGDLFQGIWHLIEQIKIKNYHISNLVNNVGNYLIKSALETNEQEWKELIDVNLMAPFLLIQAFIDTIKFSQGGIINIGVSGLNRFSADTYSPIYTMTKQSLLFLTKSLSKELAPYHVNVNMVSPGHMENSVDIPNDLSKLPTGRTVLLKEVADVVLFLLDSKQGQITGQNIEVAGGVRL